jgi:uncharacterized coiled-coil protein SlyX
MSRDRWRRLGNTVLACTLALTVALVWAAGDVSAKKDRNRNNTPNPSDTGAANGVAHRVAALEAQLAETQDVLMEVMDAVVMLQETVEDLEGDVALLQDDVADLNDRLTAVEDELTTAP